MPEIAGITIESAGPRSIAAIGAFRDRESVFAALESELGVAPPRTLGFVQAGGVSLSCLAPSRFLASGDRRGNLLARLGGSLEGLACIIDEGDMWETLLLSGRELPDTLARIVPIDVAPAMFRVGSLALTRAGHLDVRLWRVAESRYEIATTRSYAMDLLHTVQTAALSRADAS